MMRQYELVERVLEYDAKADEALLNKAYVYAMRAHGHQQRASGDPYFSHPLEVAAILTDLKLDDATIATALLHDVIEDTETTRAEIDTLFGHEIGQLVDGLTKIKKLDLVSKQAEQAENFRKLLIAISSDIRVLLVKLADRLHNMRTLEHMKPASRQRIAAETLEIYAPLAGRMGMQGLREELEHLSFRWVHPEAFEAVTGKVEALRERNRGIVQEIKSALEDMLAKAGIKGEISGRAKRPYSIWRKMENRQISLEQLSDIFGFRIIVETVEECYRILGVAHTTWRAVPARFKDYVSTPKQNNYRSIHTIVVGPRHQRVELQIRTAAMHDVAEYGVAAHALYTDGLALETANGESSHEPNLDTKITTAFGNTLSREDNPYIWLRKLVETLLEGDNPEEFLEHTKLELFQDQVFCFTPKGRLIALPSGASPIDFAYAVHTDVGNSCIGCTINGRQVALMTVLHNGDEVEIRTSPDQTPPAAWERIAVTGKARSAIRRAARGALRLQYSELGRQLVSGTFEQAGLDMTADVLERGLARLSHETAEDVFAAVGRGELHAKDVLRAAAPGTEVRDKPTKQRLRPRNRLEQGSSDEGWFNLAKVMGLKFRWPGSSSGNGDDAPVGQGIPIRGLRGDVPVEFAESGAVPGDRIVGILTAGKGIRIFPINSPKLSEFEDYAERWIDVTWDIDESSQERFPARILVSARNQPGTLAQIAQIIGETDGNIDNLHMVERAIDFTQMLIELEVWDLKHLNRIIAEVKQKSVVSAVERIFD